MSEYDTLGPMGAEIKAVFGDEGLHWSLAEAEGGEAALCDLVRMVPAFRARETLGIVEIGTHQGVSAAILAQFGFVRTYDPVDWTLRAVIFHDYSQNRFHRERTVRFVDGIRDGRVIRCEPFALWMGDAA